MGHVIQKQLFSLSASDTQQVREWEGKLHSLVHQVINPCIDKYFSEISGHDSDIVVDQLEIDLGVLNNRNPQALEERIREQLRSQLQHLPKISTTNIVSPLTDETSSDQRSGEEKNTQHFTRHKKYFLSFLNFLQHGVLPWWAETENIQLDSEWIEDLTRREADQITALLIEYPESLPRIIFQFSDNFITALMRHHLPDEYERVRESWQTLTRYYLLQSDEGKLRYQFWKYWLEKSSGLTNNITNNSKAFEHAVTRLLKSSPEAVKALINIPDDETYQATDPINSMLIPSKHLRNILLCVIEKDKYLKKFLTPGDSTSSDMMGAPLIDFTKSPVESPDDIQHTSAGQIEAEKNFEADFKCDQKTDLRTDKPEKRRGEDKNELYVSGAGIVLLHPFLSELFASTGLWSKNEWTSPDAQHVAVQLITFLSFGTSTMPEYQLAFPKILVNMPLSEPLNNCFELSDSHKQTADELLQAVIRHWKVLGNASSDGLREGFIQREGKILCKNDDWHLTVENKAQDILLARLPWSISFIHLPWLNKSNLHVRWTD